MRPALIGKEILDRVGAALALLLVLPLLLVAIALTKLTIGSPVFFRQARPGLHGKPFAILKLRTMREGPGSDKERLTPVGRLLRSTSLDEVPEFWNVLVGDMSLVGPRPLLPEYLARYTEEQARRHLMKPGITGWAQVHGRNRIPWEARLAMDVFYVDHWSLPLDLWILAKTPLVVLSGHGIAAEGSATMPPFLGATGKGVHRER
jgi:lipopolysaccharide/colanic/teichoic acid biosynthesis glycosyltransferase